ncbi:unnamed protein product [Closterium sp. Naga37s-1]|nr:unnamed protein product [Closterium sp. Naga37s-1]
MEADLFEAIPLAVSYPPEGRVNFPGNRTTSTNRPFGEEGPTFVPDQAAGTYPPNVEARDFQTEAGSSAGHFRRRPVVWPVCSGPSTKPTVITFRNATDTAVQPYWVDYDGKEVPYECLQPGRVYRQRSFVQHPWVFRDMATNEPFVVGKRAGFNSAAAAAAAAAATAAAGAIGGGGNKRVRMQGGQVQWAEQRVRGEREEEIPEG